MYGRCLGRPQAPVAEGGPVGFSDGRNRRDWFPGPGGYGRPKRRPNGDVILIIALILVLGPGKDFLDPLEGPVQVMSPDDEWRSEADDIFVGLLA